MESKRDRPFERGARNALANRDFDRHRNVVFGAESVAHAHLRAGHQEVVKRNSNRLVAVGVHQRVVALFGAIVAVAEYVEARRVEI